MKVMVVGGSGLLGHYVSSIFREKGHQTISVSNSSGDHVLDASLYEPLAKLLDKERPEVVINAAKAPISTDECEVRKEIAWMANVTIPENLARLQARHGYMLVHISSDWVYEGKKGEVYAEQSLPYPQNFYSFTKAVAEERIKNTAERHLILRPTGLFGIDPRGSNFFMRLKSTMEKGQKIGAPSDQYSQPIYAGELARAIYAAVERNAEGVYNSVGKDYVSRYELALMFCDAFGWDRNLLMASGTAQRSIKIPCHLKVDISKLEGIIGKMPPLTEQIKNFKCEEVG